MTFGGAGNDIINERVEVHELFPTPLYVVTLSFKESYKIKEEFRKESLKVVYNEREKPKNEIEPYVTLSWLNWTSDNQFHHYHAHPNSLVSGVFYIECEQTDSIVFELGNYKRILIDSERTDRFNTHKYTLPVQKHDLILFPSELIHAVEEKQQNGKERISLSFNSFVTGTLGRYDRATELKL